MCIASAAVHAFICLVMAAFTGTWLLWLVVAVPAVVVPATLARFYPDSLLSRLVMAAGFMSLTGLIIEQSGGDMEAHFSFFVMMSILVVYHDWRPLAAALFLIFLHHAAFTILQPMSLGFFVWNDARNGWGHLVVHGAVGTTQLVALSYLAMILRKRLHFESENAMLGDALRDVNEKANHDPLTGLFNRRYLEAATRDIDPAKQDIAICVVDIDHFKRVNDRYGHDAGDDVLRMVASTIHSLTGPDDFVARYGGEEFVVMLNGDVRERLHQFAENIRQKIALKPTMSELGPIIVTASIGVARWRGDDGFVDVFRRADRALYKAKAEGRNRIEMEREESRPALQVDASGANLLQAG